MPDAREIVVNLGEDTVLLIQHEGEIVGRINLTVPLPEPQDPPTPLPSSPEPEPQPEPTPPPAPEPDPEPTPEETETPDTEPETEPDPLPPAPPEPEPVPVVAPVPGEFEQILDASSLLKSGGVSYSISQFFADGDRLYFGGGDYGANKGKLPVMWWDTDTENFGNSTMLDTESIRSFAKGDDGRIMVAYEDPKGGTEFAMNSVEDRDTFVQMHIPGRQGYHFFDEEFFDGKWYIAGSNRDAIGQVWSSTDTKKWGQGTMFREPKINRVYSLVIHEGVLYAFAKQGTNAFYRYLPSSTAAWSQPILLQGGRYNLANMVSWGGKIYTDTSGWYAVPPKNQSTRLLKSGGKAPGELRFSIDKAGWGVGYSVTPDGRSLLRASHVVGTPSQTEVLVRNLDGTEHNMTLEIPGEVITSVFMNDTHIYAGTTKARVYRASR